MQQLSPIINLSETIWLTIIPVSLELPARMEQLEGEVVATHAATYQVTSRELVCIMLPYP